MLLLKPFSPEGNACEVKSTCKYPADDVYTLLELTEPDSRAICSVELHDDDVQRLMVTKSEPEPKKPPWMSKEVKERRISFGELMSHLQSS